MRTGVLGGTFDPPHLGHLALAAAARETLQLDRVLFVPAGEPWRKADGDVTPADQRVRMVEAAIADLPWAEIDTIEVERQGPSYASETMRELVARGTPGDEWWFILGADALADLPQWHEPEALLAACRLAVAVRPPAASPVSDEVRARFPGIEERLDLVPLPPLDVASTELRERVAAGVATDHLLPVAVRQVIETLGLYR